MTADTKGTEHVCVGCGAPQAPCATCGGTSFRYEPTCDLCHEPIRQDQRSPRGWFRDAASGRILNVHSACVGAFDMRCSICDAPMSAMGDVQHDMKKHLEIVEKQRVAP